MKSLNVPTMANIFQSIFQALQIVKNVSCLPCYQFPLDQKPSKLDSSLFEGSAVIIAGSTNNNKIIVEVQLIMAIIVSFSV